MLISATIPQIVSDSDSVRYSPKPITLIITVRSTYNLKLVQKRIMTSQSESPCL